MKKYLFILLMTYSTVVADIALEGSFATQNVSGGSNFVDSMAIPTTTGSNRLLVVMTSSENGANNFWITGIDYGTRASPTALIFAGREKGNTAAFVEIWYATDAIIAGGAEDSIYFTWDLSCTSCEIVASVSMWSGVDQTELVTDSTEDNRTTGTATLTGTMSTDVAIGDLLIGVVEHTTSAVNHDWTTVDAWTEAYDAIGSGMTGGAAYFIALATSEAATVTAGGEFGRGAMVAMTFRAIAAAAAGQRVLIRK